ncbi:hypothetical protein [Oryzihumus sp.]|uniref:hypothetical protein n=1 Tax=Oryzihumus sp. TaxID=1968903 RepID=UPI002EDA569C
MTTSRNRPPAGASLLAALLALTLAACGRSGGTAPAATSGSARLVAACQGSACASVARVTITVSKGDGSDFTPITADLAQGSGQWSARIDQIPAGSGRRFDAVAYDQGGAKLYVGAGKTDIVAGATALVSMVLRSPTPPPPLENAVPLIDSLSSSRELVAPGATIQVNVWAHDPNPADVLTYQWRSSCGGSFDDAGKAAPRWTAPAAEGTCPLTVTVSDDHGAAVSATLTITVTRNVGDVVVNVQMVDWPVIGSLSGSITLGTTMQGDLAVIATDPAGEALTYAWTSTCPGVAFDLNVPYGPTHPHVTVPGPSAACAVTVTVTTPSTPVGTVGALYLPPNQALGSRCQNVTCQSGQTCDPADGLCKATTSACATVTCAPPDPCHPAGVCDPATGACSQASLPDGSACNDGKACTTGDVCTAGVCAGTVSCPAGQACDATGQCSGGTDPCAGVPCNAPPACHVAAGATCFQGVCSYPPAVDGTACDDGRACTAGDACTGGVCAGTIVCPSGQTCDASGQCAASTVLVPRPVAAKDLAISMAGLAQDRSGAAYAAGSVFQPAKTFDGISVTSAGGADLFLAKYDAATHLPVWAKAYGDASDQLAAGAAVTADGTLVAIGNFIGTLAAGNTITNASQSPVDFLVAVDAATGNGRWAKSFDDGLGGALVAVAANPSLNRIAVCGYTNQAATALVPGARYGGGQKDAVLAVFSSTGALQWAKQLGGANEEECDALAIDDNGDVFAAGKYDGALDPGLGALPSPGSSFRRWIWVAKYAGATGAPIAQASFGSGAGIHTPKSITVDAAGKLIMTGTFTATLPFGTTSLVSAGGTDVFVAKIDPAASFAPAWAVRMGGTISDEGRGIAVDSLGDVVVAGLFNGTTTGAATLTASSTAASDAFLLKLDGATGSTQFGAAYGDVYTQDADFVAINRLGAGTAKDLVDFGGNFASVIDFGSAGSLATSGQNETHGFLVFANLLP